MSLALHHSSRALVAPQIGSSGTGRPLRMRASCTSALRFLKAKRYLNNNLGERCQGYNFLSIIILKCSLDIQVQILQEFENPSSRRALLNASGELVGFPEGVPLQ